MSQSRSRIRCAIYTRKSSDEGLDQDFNSLDAQHEACLAFVASQRQEGWVASKARYDDAGLSGGTLERPALQRLLADIDVGRIQMVVVYKIDRLTRSLADFAKLVERFDAAGCSFVSVTQAFNTASSMGRLTLNVLLSFAQFEREVTAERIRDKIAASKRKGLWMGGLPPLGYDPHPDPKTRSLIVAPREAETVRTIFTLYDTLGCLNAVMGKAKEMGLRSKLRRFASGRVQGGTPLSRGQIYALIRNPIYIGKIRHKTKVWDGQHAPIVEEDLWHRVQAKLQAASARPRRRAGSARATDRYLKAPLTGKLRDETGDRLTPTHTKRNGRQIRYYVSNRLVSGGADPTGWRLPAHALEQAVTDTIAHHIAALAERHQLCSGLDLQRSEALRRRADDMAHRLSKERAAMLAELVSGGTIKPRYLVVQLSEAGLSNALNIEPVELDRQALSIEAPFALRRRGVEGKVVLGDRSQGPDLTLLRALANAHAWIADLRAGTPLSEIAAQTGHSDSYIRTRAQLAFLSPTIQQAILAGRQPPDLTLQRIVRKPVPLSWQAQAQLYGVDRARP
ncbi:MAG: recombinase family protein [Pseudomonadota bacterium]